MKISITLALILLVFSFVILPTLMLVVFLFIPKQNKQCKNALQTQESKLVTKIKENDVEKENLVSNPTNITVWTKNKSEKAQNILKVSASVFFILYLIFLFTLVFGQVYLENGFLYVKLIKNSSWFSLSFATAYTDKINIAYNLTMMFPVSAFVFATQNVKKCNSDKQYYLKVFLKTILISFLISLFIETFQFILPIRRTTELFDLLTNTISGALGFCYFCPVVLVCSKLRHKQLRQDQE